MTKASMKKDQAEKLAFKVVEDMGGAFVMALGYIGSHLGLFEALADSGPMTSQALAEKTKLNDSYVRDWAKAMAAAEYIGYDPETEKFKMTEEQAFVLINRDSPLFVGGALKFATPTTYNVPEIMEAFRSGGGIRYSEIGDEIPEAIEQFFRPTYLHSLTDEWVPKVSGLKSKLDDGASVADIGCGCGQSTVIMAKAYPKSEILGVDTHQPSIDRAQMLSKQEGTNNAHFLCSTAEAIASSAQKFDVVCTFDCVHDMADPLSALRSVRTLMTDDGVYLWAEPNASDNPLENRNPVGRCFSAISPLHCLTVSLAEDGAGLGTVIGENGARKLADEVGFSSFRRLPVENPFVQVFELRR